MYNSLGTQKVMYTQPYHCNVRIGRDHRICAMTHYAMQKFC